MKKIMSIQIQPGITKNQRLTIAKIFYQSFKEKFTIIFGGPKKASKLIARLIHKIGFWLPQKMINQ